MLRVGKDKVTQFSLVHTGSFDERDLIGGMYVVAIEYSGWENISVRTREASRVKVLLQDPRGLSDRAPKMTVEGGIEEVIALLNVVNGTTD